MVSRVAVRASALAILMLTVGLAGCAEETAEVKATDTESPEPGARSGAIQGQVVDQESLPVAGASVVILEDSVEAMTDEDGVFVFNDVTPGSKRIFVQKLGYDSVGKSVQVIAGETAQMSVTLAAVLVADPWQETQVGDGFMTCQWSTPVVKSRIACNAISDPEKSTFEFPVQPGLTETLTETIWEQTSALSPEYMELDHFFDGDEKEENIVQKSPHVHKSTDYDEFDGEEIIEESYWLPFGNQSQPVIFAFQQRFTVYLSAFYHQTVPAGFSAADV